MELLHKSHPKHPLKLVNSGKLFECFTCKEFGLGARYCCEKCNNIHLHEECMRPESTTHHEFCKGSVFKFFDVPPKPRPKGSHHQYCVACGIHVKGCAYYCGNSGRYLHPRCKDLPYKLTLDDGKVLRLCETSSSKCKYCGRKNVREEFTGWSYVKKSIWRKNSHFHVHCVKEKQIQSWKDNYFASDKNSVALKKKSPDTKQITTLGSRSKKTNKFLKYARIMFSIASSIFGDPTGGIVTATAYALTN